MNFKQKSVLLLIRRKNGELKSEHSNVQVCMIPAQNRIPLVVKKTCPSIYFS